MLLLPVFFSALTLVKYRAALCYFNSQSLRNPLREQINFKSLQCPVVVMLRCNVLTVLQWLLSASILGTGLWTTFSSNVPRRKVLLLFQMRGNMLFRPSAAVLRPKKTPKISFWCRPTGFCAEFTDRNQTTALRVYEQKKTNRFCCLLIKLEEILLHRSPASRSLVCVLLSRSIIASVSCPLFFSLSYLSPNRRCAHTQTHTETKEKLEAHTYTGTVSLKRQLMGCCCCRLWLRSCAGKGLRLQISHAWAHKTTLVFFISHATAISFAPHVKGIDCFKLQ